MYLEISSIYGFHAGIYRFHTGTYGFHTGKHNNDSARVRLLGYLDPLGLKLQAQNNACFWAKVFQYDLCLALGDLEP